MLTEISVSVAIGLLIFVIYLMRLVIKQKRNLNRFQGVIDVETEQAKVKTALEKEQEIVRQRTIELRSEAESIEKRKTETERTLTSLKEQLTPLEDEAEIQSYGIYQPKYDLGFSTELKDRLDQIRKKQKAMIREKTAIICSTNWTIEGSRAEGRKMTNRQIQLMARAFNGECDSIILKVKYNSLTRIEDRINAVYKAINKLGEPNACKIQQSYLNLKIDELHVVHQYQEQLQFEKEEQRRINEQIREEQRAQRELEKAQREADKEEKRYQKALDEARREIEQATGKKQEKLQLEIQRLNELVLEAQTNKERAMSRAQMTRSGHVYIISNIGSFGENVYKIGMTRRLEPTDRVRELGDASVPFRFDIHAMIYSEDAPALENHLHGLLETRSVNRINSRKEFFNVSLKEIEKIVHEYNVEAQFIRVPPAEEFRKTQAIIAQEINGNSEDLQ